MMYWDNGMGLWGMLFMLVGSLLFWGLIITGIVLLVRYLGRTGQPARPADADDADTAAQQLAQRYARGEIDEDEYTERLSVLSSTKARRSGG
ncbi:SHOCT domain-containing protein [Promicromonospora soli]